MDERIDDQALYDACQQNGSAAQADAYALISGLLYRTAYAMLHDYPDADMIAQDCMQKALIKIHHNLLQCHDPSVFRAWCKQVARRVVLDELRRPDYRRRAALEEAEHMAWAADAELLRTATDLRALLLEVITTGPLSSRSRRVVLGRFFEEQRDEALARIESELAGREVRPSHIQVTRTKNLAALRQDPGLLDRLEDLLDS